MMLNPDDPADRRITAYTISQKVGYHESGGTLQATWSFD